MKEKGEKLKHPRFITSAVDPKGFPRDHNLPEIAVVGRSNVGKSSLLNHLFQVKGLVKTSATPGKTQLINFFRTDDLSFVDLPGYGYAKVPPAVRKQWGPMMEGYFTTRENLKLILLLIDSRREPDDEDFAMLDYAEQSGKPIIIVMTKTDKLNQSELHKQSKVIEEAFNGLPIVKYRVDHEKPRQILLKAIIDSI